MRRSTVFLLVSSLGFLCATCTTDSVTERAAALIKDGHGETAVALLETAVSRSPHDSAPVQALQTARLALFESARQQALEELRQGRYESALHIVKRAAPLVPSSSASQSALLLQQIGQAAEEYVTVLQSHERHARAVELSTAIAEAVPDPTHAAWAARVRTEAAAFFQGESERLQKDYPGSAALQLALAQPLVKSEAAAQSLRSDWQRFTHATCFAEPTLDVHGKGRGRGTALPGLIQGAGTARLRRWRQQCGRGVKPMHVHVTVESMDFIDQVARSPGAVAKRGVQGVAEILEPGAHSAPDTEETIAYESRTQSVEHRDCSRANASTCRQWSESVQRQVPIRQLKIIDRLQADEHWRLDSELPADRTVRFERTTESRRVTCRGYITIDGAPFASLPFALSAESADTAHPDVYDTSLVLAADPLQLASSSTLYGKLAGRVADIVLLATQEAADSWAETTSERATGLQNVEPDRAEELYLATLALGFDSGQDVRTFFGDRYGKPADEVLATLTLALGQKPPTDKGAAAADLTLLYPHVAF